MALSLAPTLSHAQTKAPPPMALPTIALPDVSLPSAPPPPMPTIPPPPGTAASAIPAPPEIPGIPAPPPLPDAPSPAANKLPKLKTIAEIPPAKQVAPAASKPQEKGWFDKVKTMVMGDDTPAKTDNAKAPPAGAPPLPPLPGKLATPAAKAVIAKTEPVKAEPEKKIAAPALPPLPAVKNAESAPKLPPLPDKKPEVKTAAKPQEKSWFEKAKAIVFSEEAPKKPAAADAKPAAIAAAPPPVPLPGKSAAPALPPLPDAKTAEVPKLPEIPVDALKLPEPKMPDNTLATPALPPLPGEKTAESIKLPEPKMPSATPALPPLPGSVAKLAAGKAAAPVESKTTTPAFPELAMPTLPGMEGKTPPPPLAPPIAKNEKKDSALNDEEEEKQPPVDPDTFEFGALNKEGNKSVPPKEAADTKPDEKSKMASKPGDAPKDEIDEKDVAVAPEDAAAKLMKGHDFHTQVLPTILNRKEYETRNQHLPKAVFKDDLERLLFVAIGRGDLNAMRALLNNGVDIEAHNAIGDTPLVHAAINGQAGAVRVLLARGANPNNANVHGLTAMQVAAERGREDIIEALFEMGAKATADYRNPLTPLKSGVGRGYASVYNAMLDGENPNARKAEARDRALQALADAGPAPRVVIAQSLPGMSKEIRDPRLKKTPGAPLTFDEIESSLAYQEYVRKTGDDPASRIMGQGTVPKMISPAGSSASPVPVPYPAAPPVAAPAAPPAETKPLYRAGTEPGMGEKGGQVPDFRPSPDFDKPAARADLPADEELGSGQMDLGEDGLPNLPGADVKPTPQPAFSMRTPAAAAEPDPNPEIPPIPAEHLRPATEPKDIK